MDRNFLWNERMFANALHILRDACFLMLDRMPLDEMTGDMSAVMVRIAPGLSVEGRCPEIVLKQIGDDFLGE